jgi:Domain of unknown function (DUF4252)
MDTRRSAFLVLGIMLPGLCVAQRAELNVPSLAAMQREAVESVNITLGPVALGFMRFIGRFAGDHDPDSAAAMNVLRGLNRVQVHNFQFATDHAYTQADLEPLRTQLTSPGWHQMVQVRNRSTSENVDIYCALDNHTVKGVVILAAEPREFTLVSIVGTIDFDQIGKLRHAFVPRERGRQPVALTQSDGSVSPQNDGL